MRAEIISIGTEILVGSIVNSNARFLSQKLAENAVDVYHHVTVGDNPERLLECLKTAALRSDLIITSGGLGPTEDDVTVAAAAHFLGQRLTRHRPTYAHILRRLKKRRMRMTPLIARQCDIPEKAHVLMNDNGTASGLVCEKNVNGRLVRLLLLPGPPREIEPMFVQKALPYLRKRKALPKESFVVRSVRLAGLIEVQVAQKVNDLLRLKPPVTVGIYAKPGQVELKVMAKHASRKIAERMAARVERVIRKRFGKFVYGVNDDSLASVTGELLRRRRKTLAIAESCTGGLVSHLITEVPGSSDVLLGSVVAYSNSVKKRTLQVPPALLARHGAVSPEVARSMARHVREIFGADHGLGITGIAGPSGGSKKKPVGLVFIALADRTGCRVKRFVFLGKRSDIKLRAAETAIDLLRLRL